MMRVFEEVHGSQRVFRCLLEAVSSPGKLFVLPPFEGERPEESVLHALLDHEVSLCVVGGGAETSERLASVTGARLATLREADFALIHDPDETASKMRRGTLERPELGATAVYVVERLSGGGALTLKLSGPGVPGERLLGVEGLGAGEMEAIRSAREGYPLGVDVYLVDEAGRIAGLPRSTRLEVI